MKNNGIFWFEILSTVVVCFLTSLVTALFFNFDVDKLKLFYENASFDVQFLLFVFNFIFPFVFDSYFTKFCFWIKSKFKNKNKVVK
ncbi:hypothetical protein [Spiroplasma endosymbiont of Amphimallon solstitiale]|uniref:hypothetical protein n=1 Tax=Spiroplasma endosymbiont of Amphimallon solstitiale TaxID=3066288 RepID=UPI00313EB1FC